MNRSEQPQIVRLEIDCGPCPSITSEIHQFAESLGKAIDAKDHYTRQHSQEVALVAQMLALNLGFARERADHIHIAGHLHDIGKIGISDRILKKRGPLTQEEWVEVKKHPVVGADILAPVGFLRSHGIVDMVRHHHESFDGRGYPGGLAGEEIPLGARLIAVSDSLSAMLQDRPYRRGMSFDQAMADILSLSGLRYDPRVVAVLETSAGRVADLIADLKGNKAPRLSLAGG